MQPYQERVVAEKKELDVMWFLLGIRRDSR